MSEAQLQVVYRVAVATAGVSYVVVFVMCLVQGTAPEVAMLKAVASMVCLGLIGWIVLTILSGSEDEELIAPRGNRRRLDVALPATPEEVSAGNSTSKGKGKRK